MDNDVDLPRTTIFRGGGYSSVLRAVLVRDSNGNVIYQIFPLALESPRLDMSLLISNPPPKEKTPMRLIVPKQVDELMDEIERNILAFGETSPLESVWPTDFPLVDGSRIPAGLVVRSLSGAMEGRTTGLRRRCPATSEHCPGWLIGVVWEDGQELHICSEGWRYDPATREIRVIAGGEISARFTDRKGPLPRGQWPTRAALLSRPGWSTTSSS